MPARPSRTVRVIYSGRVQGVGFRWTTARVARGYEVAGSVRNLSDGTVELIAQGDDSEVTAFLDAVADAMRGYIDEARIEENFASASLLGFSIAH